jgi:beta-galactosidase
VLKDPRRVMFGAAYYHEYQPEARLDEDLDLMADAGFTVIRVGEATWARWEPSDGEFDLDWLAPVLDGAHARGIGVIIGTPTFALPMWMTRKHPELAVKLADGARMGWGRREEIDLTSPTFRFYAERVTRRIVTRYAGHPAVIGYQAHNEPGLHLIYNDGAVEGFRDHLARTYESVEELNRRWGLVFWSHDLSDWSDLWHPQGNAQPQYDLAWRRYQAHLTTEFIAWLADVVRDHALPQQFVTTDVALDRPAVHESEVADALDVAGVNAYYRMQDGFQIGAERATRKSWITAEGPWVVALKGDRGYAAQQAPFLVFETNASAAGGPADNHPPYNGQLRQAAWSLVSRGATMVEYWHWQSLHYGTETYWGGVLPHDQKPGRVYREVQQLGAELQKAGPDVASLTPDYDVAFLYSLPSKWGLAYQPYRADDTSHPHIQRNERAYQEINEALYRGAFERGAQARLIHDRQVIDSEDRILIDPEEAARTFPRLVAAGLYVASDAMLAWLDKYAEAGGHLLVGVRTGYANEEANARRELKPALLSTGATYQEFTTLDEPVSLRASEEFALPADAAALHWADGLMPSDAVTLASYDHPQFGSWACLTTRPHGAGRISTLGAVPNPSFSRRLLEWFVPDAVQDEWGASATTARVSSGVNPSGRRIQFLHNWSWEPATLRVPKPSRDVLSGESIDSGETLQLGSWDVRVISDVTPH